MRRDECVYCGAENKSFHLDHVVPRSRGGPDHPSNLVLACAYCNTSKGDRLPSEWLATPSEHVLRIEKEVCARVELRARARREMATPDEPVRFPCEACGEDLAKELRKGVVLWFGPRTEPREPGHDVVDGFFLAHQGDCAESVRAAMGGPGRFDHFDHLSNEVGDRAMVRLVSLFEFYSFDRENMRVFRKMVGFYILASMVRPLHGHEYTAFGDFEQRAIATYVGWAEKQADAAHPAATDEPEGD